MIVVVSALFTIAVLCVVVACLVVSNIKLWIELKAMRASTHQVTFLDPTKEALEKFGRDHDFEPVTEELRKKLNEQDDEYADVG